MELIISKICMAKQALKICLKEKRVPRLNRLESKVLNMAHSHHIRNMEILDRNLAYSTGITMGLFIMTPLIDSSFWIFTGLGIILGLTSPFPAFILPLVSIICLVYLFYFTCTSNKNRARVIEAVIALVALYRLKPADECWLFLILLPPIKTHPK